MNSIQMFDYIAQRFADVLINGGSPAIYFRAHRMVKRLAKHLGVSHQELLEAITESVS